MAQDQPKEAITSLRLLTAPIFKTRATSGTTNFSGSWRGTLTANSDPTSNVWTEEFDLQQDANGNLTGTRKTIPQQNPNNWVVWNISGSATGGEFGFQDVGIRSQGNASLTPCVTTGAMYISSDGTSFSGDWTAPSCSGGTITAVKVTAPVISLTRESLLSILADAAPQGGTFSLTSTATGGTLYASIALASGSTATSNPATLSISEPVNPSPNGKPTPGGLLNESVQFTAGTQTDKTTFKIPVFGMSCYDTTLESDWGTPPSSCKSITIQGTTYAGTVNNPDGLTGTYCKSFIAQVGLNGSGITNSGQQLQLINGSVVPVTQIKTADGAIPVVGKTLARDRNIVPRNTTLIVNGFGSAPLAATDTGGDITGYRLDQYEGNGNAVCAGFRNTIRVATCSPSSANCPGSAVP